MCDEHAKAGDTIESPLHEGKCAVILSGYEGVSIKPTKLGGGGKIYIFIPHGQYIIVEKRTKNTSAGKDVDTFLREQTDNNLRGVFT